MQKTQVWSLSQEDPLEEEMETHSNILAWEIPGTEEAGGYVHWVAKESDNLATKQQHKEHDMKKSTRDFPCGPVVKTPHSHSRE